MLAKSLSNLEQYGFSKNEIKSEFKKNFLEWFWDMKNILIAEQIVQSWKFWCLFVLFYTVIFLQQFEMKT